MVNELSDWIKEALDKGYSADKLKEEAMSMGYSKKEVEKAIFQLQPEKAEVKKGKKPKIWVFIIIGAIIAISAAAIFTYSNRPSEELSEKEKLRQDCIAGETRLCQALLADDESFCPAVEYDCREFYYLGNALRTGDIESCDKNMTGPFFNVFCKAFLTNNNSFCENLEITEDIKKEDIKTCSNLISAIKENKCDTLNISNLKGLCFTITIKDKKYCSYFTEKCYALI